jgi:hypothetical protein
MDLENLLRYCKGPVETSWKSLGKGCKDLGEHLQVRLSYQSPRAQSWLDLFAVLHPAPWSLLF